MLNKLKGHSELAQISYSAKHWTSHQIMFCRDVREYKISVIIIAIYYEFERVTVTDYCKKLAPPDKIHSFYGAKIYKYLIA